MNLSWPVRSARNLAITVVVAVAVLVGGGMALGLAGSSQPPPAPAPTFKAHEPVAAPYVSKAVQFVRLWSQIQPGQTQADWAALLAPIAADDLHRALTATDPANLPGVPQSGTPTVVAIDQQSALVEVPLKGAPSVYVTVVDQAGVLYVTDIQPATGD